MMYISLIVYFVTTLAGDNGSALCKIGAFVFYTVVR